MTKTTKTKAKKTSKGSTKKLEQPLKIKQGKQIGQKINKAKAFKLYT